MSTGSANHPTFEQRIAELRTAAQVLATEVMRMEAAAVRFAQKKAQRKTASL